METSVLGSELSRTISFLDEIKRIDRIDDLIRAIYRTTNGYGIQNILCGFMPRRGMLPSEQMRHILISDCPQEWLTTYFENGYLFEDPMIKQCRRMESTIVWSEIAQTGRITARERFVMDRAKEFGLIDGCTVPLVSLDGRVGGFSFSGSKIDISPEARGALTLIATFAFGRAIELTKLPVSGEVRLTEKELEVLRWLSQGKTDWETGIIMGVTAKAIEKHVTNIRFKLNVMNRSHAIAEAFRRNLIA
ncbi:LuxR family transcriptional regulator [Allorhizobium sp. BGMRC 0089]|uniref:helix-turn-helix transcriptional regulator n=1 Tax=Allorhizobium sonneratiae TaxID=2934936 RepID=UPI0020336839|nr:LuxR family transcriptional regulator [Allorhizobium sonneratiae]MCM2294686.1 LuxR family transcriptional regulator [Allorhizobium sonneratiae]